MEFLEIILIFLNILFIICNLIDIFRIYKFATKIKKITTQLTMVLNFIKNINKIKKKEKKKMNLIFFFKNLKKVLKYIDGKTFYPIILGLLFSSTLTFCESGSDIHHYILNDKGEFIEVTNEEERLRIEKEKMSKETEEEEPLTTKEKIVVAIIIISFIAFISYMSYVCYSNFDWPSDILGDEPKSPIEEFLKQKEKPRYTVHPLHNGWRNANVYCYNLDFVDKRMEEMRQERLADLIKRFGHIKYKRTKWDIVKAYVRIFFGKSPE